MRSTTLTALALALLCVPAMSAQQDSVLLRRELKPNFEDNYKMTVAMKQTITLPNGMVAPEVTMTITSDIRFKGGDVFKADKLPVTITVSNYSMDSTVPVGVDDMPKTVTLQGMMDTRNTFSEAKADHPDPKIQAMNKQIMQLMQNNGFPEKPVKPGDTWEVSTVPSPIFANKPLKFHLKFEGERMVDSEAYWVVTSKDTVFIDADLSELAAEGGQPGTEGMTMKGDMDVTMEILYEKTGRLYSLLGNVQTDVEVDSPQSNGKIHVIGDVIQRMNLTN